MGEVIERAVYDTEQLVAGGVDGVIVENFFDAPFTSGRVEAETVASMAVALSEVQEAAGGVPVGVNVLRNDALSALALAVACGADFIRVNVMVGARLTDQGIIQSPAYELARRRTMPGASRIVVMADVGVKHSTPLGAPIPLEVEALEAVERGGADAVIVTGSRTGGPADESEVARVASAVDVPVIVGSGVTPDNVSRFVGAAQGFIVGTWFKRGGIIGEPVDSRRVVALMDALAA